MKETYLPWNLEEGIPVYFTKLHKEQERSKKSAITGMTKKFTQAFNST